MIITLSFSAVVYSSTINRTQRALETQEKRMRNRIYSIPSPQVPPSEALLDEQEIQEIKRDTLTTLGVINAFILIIIGLPGYWLAGKTLRPIEEMVEKQKKFVANAAHELKTPLTAIKTNLEVNLRDKKLDLKKAKKIMENTIEDVDSLTLLTNSLIKQSRYQNYSNEKQDIFELKELIERVIKKVKPEADKKGIKIELSGNDIQIKGTKESISELITIFVDNAIKFSKEKGSVKIHLEKNNECASIKIKDNGNGIDKKDIPHIFDRFYKSDTSRSRSQNDGFGLGLSIAKEIAESHGGKISVKSERGKGSKFLIKLPLSQ